MIIWNFTESELKKDLSDISQCFNYNSNYGSKIIRFYFQSEIVKIKNRRNLSFIDWLEAGELEKPYNKRIFEWKINRSKNELYNKYATYQMFGGGGCSSVFKVSVAKWLIQYFKATSVLDFSSGYGGRCLGAIVCNSDYIGYDTNVNLKQSYLNLLDLVKPKTKVQIFFEDSAKADFSKHKYDLVFTSPPYYDKKGYAEKYDCMPLYKTREDFNSSFFFPVVRNSFQHLSKKGWFCLNIPDQMYDDVKDILGECRMSFPLPIRQNKKHKSKTKVYSERIYCWYKS